MLPQGDGAIEVHGADHVERDDGRRVQVGSGGRGHSVVDSALSMMVNEFPFKYLLHGIALDMVKHEIVVIRVSRGGAAVAGLLLSEVEAKESHFWLFSALPAAIFDPTEWIRHSPTASLAFALISVSDVDFVPKCFSKLDSLLPIVGLDVVPEAESKGKQRLGMPCVLQLQHGIFDHLCEPEWERLRCVDTGVACFQE